MPEQTLTLGFSPCPNDTFLFHALVHGLVEAPRTRFRERLEDVETLNRMALSAVGTARHAAPAGACPLDVSKVSFGALPYLLDEYVLLRSGAALGRGCGPLLVCRTPPALDRPAALRIAVPGRFTTANLLLRLWRPELPPGTEYVYSEIVPAVVRGEVDAGLIIHESRFTYASHGLRPVVDLGAWWEQETGLPIPLGGIVARRALGVERVLAVEAALAASVEHAFADPTASAAYVRAHAQEMDAEVTRRHIELYVNAHSVRLGAEGEAAVRALLDRARAAGLTPDAPYPFAS